METRTVGNSTATGGTSDAMLAAQADLASQLAGRVADRTGSAMIAGILGENAAMLNQVKYLANTVGYANDSLAVGQTSTSRVANAVVRTGGDIVVDAAVSGATTARLLSSAAGVGSAFSLADAFVGDGRAMSVVTELGSSLDISANIQHGVHGAVDSLYIASLAARGDTGGAYQAADRMQEGTLNGRYGSVTQGYAAATALMTADRQALDTLTDEAASTGERGTLAAWGNCAGEMIYSAITSDYSDEGFTFVPDAR